MIRINLLPVRAAKKKESVRFQLTVAGLITFFIVALAGLLYINISSEASSLKDEIRQGEDELRELRKKIGELSKIKEQKKKLEDKLKIVRKLEAARGSPVKLLIRIIEAIPRKAWLYSLVERDRIVVLKGYAGTDDIVAEFMRNLQRYEEFGRVELEVLKKTRLEGLGRDLFEFVLRLERKKG